MHHRERERESGERNRESQIKNERERDGDSTKSPRENVKREVWERRKRERGRKEHEERD